MAILPPRSRAQEVEENSGGEEDEEEVVVGQDDDDLDLGLCLGSKKQQPSPAPCRILTARDLQPGSLSPDSSVSSSSPAAGAGATTPSKRAKADAAPNATTSPGTVAPGHPQREAAADAQLAAARARLAEALAELERARVRAAELQRRLEQTYGKRRRLVEEAQGRIHEIRARLRHHQDQDRDREHEQESSVAEIERRKRLHHATRGRA